jgi:hypothetical protein
LQESFYRPQRDRRGHRFFLGLSFPAIANSTYSLSPFAVFVASGPTSSQPFIGLPPDRSKTRKLFKLIAKGADRIPVIVDLAVWSDKYLKIPPDKPRRWRKRSVTIERR